MTQPLKLARSGDEENTPPPPKVAKSKTRSGIFGAASRRRARFTGGVHHPRYAVESARHKSSVRSQPSLINIELPRIPGDALVSEMDPSNATSQVSTSNLTLPRYLSRPIFNTISKQTIATIAPELADTEVQYIRSGLESFGPQMLQVLAGVKAEPISNVLPSELDVVIKDLSSDMPTHVVAVYSRNVSTATKRRVTLYPVHNIILAAHCANLPVLPLSNPACPGAPGSTISVPVVPLCIPAPELFPQLSTFLYTKRADHLLATLLPCPVPPPLYRDDPASEDVLSLLQQFSRRLATNHGTQSLLTSALTVNGLWRNVCALGIDDATLWCALDVAWEVLITALSISAGTKI